MRLYAGLSDHFIRDTTHNQIAEKLRDAFVAYHRYSPAPSEITSWRNSLRAVAGVFHEASLHDHGVILEYELPLTSKRLDCMVLGRNGVERDNAVIIELKQWEGASEAVSERTVVTRLGGREVETLHPSVQVGQYRTYLQDTHTAFHEGPAPIDLSACAYLHNHFPEEDDVLLSDVYRPVMEISPIFSGDDVGKLKDFLVERLDAGAGLEVLRRVEESRYRPSRKLMEHVAGVIKDRSEYTLLDEQLVIYDKVFRCARAGFHDRKKTVLIVKGGPGTGKSVIAVNLMGDLLRQSYNALHATGSKAFTNTLRNVIGTRGSAQFRFFNSFRTADRDVVDVLICDEAHRIRENSSNRFDGKENRSTRPQVDELLSAARVSVFFIDDRQVVRPGEVGSVAHIKHHAVRAGARVFEYELEAQFRCAGSEGFVNWVDNTLAIRKTANVLWTGDERFEFGIVATPTELEARIRERADTGHSARLAAGFCWPWSKPSADGTLVDDVTIGAWRRPWNARPEAGRLAKGIPKAELWAREPAGIDQVGCVYTAQGFEFDYIGVIWGADLRYDLDAGQWVGDKKQSFDNVVKRSKDQFVELLKNTYRVLLSRGLKGCYVHFVDRGTEQFVRSRME